ncbi:MAG: T9SS type A sorting domain-containing protein, partial [Bacteroidetes bacterium]|nr:T9SS type A sorting domain-containing protein [Bacteroidota bacterium]
TWEETIGGNRTFTLSGDTTLYWKCFSNECSWGDEFPFPEFEVNFKVNMAKAINTNGFDKAKDTLIARIGFLGTAIKTVDAKLSAPLLGTVFTGKTGVDSLVAVRGTTVLYQYYKKNAAGEFEEFYFDNFNTYPGSAAPKFRKAVVPLTGNSFSTEDLLNDNVSTHRQPFFRNTNPVGVPTTLTLEVNGSPAHFLTSCLGGKLNDIQGGSLMVDGYNIKSLPLYVNGPATGGWQPWDSLSLGLPRRMTYDGSGRWSISIDYPEEAAISQEFKLSIGGADNEAGFGNNHMANLFPTSTNNTKVQFGDIQPSRYKVDDQNYWDFTSETGIINGDLGLMCPWPEDVPDETPQNFSLSAWPNPFNPATLISCTVPTSGRLSLKVFDLQGRQVAVLLDEVRPAGVHQVPFRAEGLSSGVYLVRMQSGNRQESLKVMLVK